MSHSAAAAHGHDDHAADHGSLKSYIIGFVLSLLLTFGSCDLDQGARVQPYVGMTARQLADKLGITLVVKAPGQ